MFPWSRHGCFSLPAICFWVVGFVNSKHSSIPVLSANCMDNIPKNLNSQCSSRSWHISNFSPGIFFRVVYINRLYRDEVARIASYDVYLPGIACSRGMVQRCGKLCSLSPRILFCIVDINVIQSLRLRTQSADDIYFLPDSCYRNFASRNG